MALVLSSGNVPGLLGSLPDKFVLCTSVVHTQRHLQRHRWQLADLASSNAKGEKIVYDIKAFISEA